MKYFGSRISDNMVKTPEGFLICLGVPIARTGEMDYTEEELSEAEIEGDENGIVKVNRDEKEVFSAKTIASFEGKPFVVKHPEELVNPRNWSQLAKGVIKNVRRASDNKTDLVADIMITDERTIYLVESEGMREVSCGYEADYEQTSPGKGEQSNIIGNHLALVEQGRAGSGYAINDHKGESKMDFKKLFSAFAKDPEALKVMKAVTSDAKAKTEDEDMPSMDEKMGALMDKMGSAVDAMNAAVSNMAQPTTAAKDKKSKDADKEKDKDKVGDEEIPAWAQALMKRLEKLEGKSQDEDVVEDDESEEDVVADEDEVESEDEESGEEVESGDDGEGAMEVVSGDSASRIEILAPGLELDADDKSAKVKALKHCHATKDGKRIIEALSGGKKPVWTDKKTVDSLFISVSEVLKAKRSRKNSKTKFADAELIDGTPDSKVMTPEKMNEMNAKFYAKRDQAH